MNMTPRSVSMGNKVYKLHVRCGSLKETWDMCPDAPILEFQNKVEEKFQVITGASRIRRNLSLVGYEIPVLIFNAGFFILLGAF
jgi:hypothetical protein